MTLLNRLTRKLGLRKPKYGTIHPKMADYLSFKMLAAQQKMNYVDFFNELLSVYVNCKHKNHEAIIADLSVKKDALLDALMIYKKRFGKIYNTPADETHIGPNVDAEY